MKSRQWTTGKTTLTIHNWQFTKYLQTASKNHFSHSKPTPPSDAVAYFAKASHVPSVAEAFEWELNSIQSA